MKIKNSISIISLSLIIFSCNFNTNQIKNTIDKTELTKTNQDNKNNLSSSNIDKENSNVNKTELIPIDTKEGNKDNSLNTNITKENINILTNAGDYKSLKLEQSNFLRVQDFKLFNPNKGLLFLEQGDLLLLSDDKIEKIDQLEKSNLGSMCLDSNGNGLIFYVSGNEYDELRNRFYMTRLENYKVVEKDILFDDKIYPNQIPKCSFDKNGNGLILYPLHYIKKISNYKVSDKVMDIDRGFYITKNENIIKLDTQDYENYKLQNIDINSKLVTKEVTLNNTHFKKLFINEDSKNSLSFLIQNDENKLELVIVEDINNIKRIKLNGIYDNNIDSFQINENGNGVIIYTIGENKDRIVVVEVKNFSLDLSSKYEYDSLNSSSFLRKFLVSPFSYISLINNEGYVFWNRIDKEKQVLIDFIKIKT